MLIVITGSSGFLGSNLIKIFLKNNHKVIGIDRVKKKNLNNKNYIFYKCDLNDEKSLNKIKIMEKNILLHCAGQPSAAKSFEDPIVDLKANIFVTVKILNWAKKNNTKKIIYASTFNVYKENNKSIKLKETDICDPKSLYAISKKSGEDYIRLLGSYFGILDRFRDFIFIDDVVEVWYRIANSKKHFNKIYNLGSGKKTKINSLLKKIIQISNSKSLIKQENGTPGDFKGCYANIDSLKKDFNYTPQVNLETGLKLFNKWLDKLYVH